jgi:hypothetical protein
VEAGIVANEHTHIQKAKITAITCAAKNKDERAHTTLLSTARLSTTRHTRRHVRRTCANDGRVHRRPHNQSPSTRTPYPRTYTNVHEKSKAEIHTAKIIATTSGAFIFVQQNKKETVPSLSGARLEPPSTHAHIHTSSEVAQ